MKRWLAVALGCCLGAGTASADDTIEVSGQRVYQVTTYQRMVRVYDRFQKIPERARHGLSLVFVGETMPDHGFPSSAGIVIHAAQGDIPLYSGEDREMHFPITEVLRVQNPSVLQTKSSDKTVYNHISLQLTPPDATRFTDDDARQWLVQVNDCVEDLTGVILAVLMPDAHKIQVAVAPRSRLEMVQGGVVRLLVENGGATPYLYTFKPQDFARDVLFQASQPVRWVRVLAPGDARTYFEQEKTSR
ncbi:hypothetical protein [Neokomagataea anthophila]|uniref:DUF2987 domain-containing protein n=1 Tax=Neokomagataea anthophila TaxID=2826925 RepID=A0ABS5E647_9PROT|nr:hypothetical protein [Neokomagataea anthophila]MBR0559276.1 hypothetical protein [Neokomagataea anthophila]